MLPRDLIRHAMKLIADAPESAEQEVMLRRAVSAAYYALFHKINEDAVATIAPHVEPKVRHRIQRWFDHAEAKRVCGRFLSEKLDQPLLGLIGPQTSPGLKIVCRTFIQLQEARYAADYDLDYVLDPARAHELVHGAFFALIGWRRISTTHEANIFILSLLLWKNWDRDRASG